MRSAEGIARAIADLASRETPRAAWLRKAGPIARRMNEEAAREKDLEEEHG